MKKEVEKKKSTVAPKRKNSNTYDNLYLIWCVLREHASRDNPLTAHAVFDILSTQEESYPSESTVYRLFQQRQGILADIFATNVLPSRSTVQNILRKQGNSPLQATNTARISCLADNGQNYVDYDTYCDQKAEEQGVEELNHKSLPVRYYYLESPLSDGEWKILTDLIRFAPWISKEQSVNFLKVMYQLGGAPWADDEALYSFKRENKEQFDIIHTLQRGIMENKQVDIIYGTHVLELKNSVFVPTLVQRGEKGEKKIIPISFVWSKGNYYIIVRYQEEGTMHLRVDRILEAKLTEESFVQNQGFSVVEHRDRSPMMYGAPFTIVRFSCPETLLNTVLDVFGTTPRYQRQENQVNVTVRASYKGVKQFALQYLSEVEILEPKELREDLRNTLAENRQKYQ